jgi:hypothetical protein
MDLLLEILKNTALVILFLFAAILIYFFALQSGRSEAQFNIFLFKKLFKFRDDSPIIKRNQRLEHVFVNLTEKSKVAIIWFLGKTKYILIILFLLLIVMYSWVNVESVNKPIDFKRIREARYNAVIDRMLTIREVQEAYKMAKDKYAPNFNELIDFIKQDSFYVEKIVFKDEAPDSIDATEALKYGLAQKVSTPVPVYDSLFKEGYVADSLRYVPMSEGDTFMMGSGKIMTASKVEVQVFELSVSNDILLRGLDKQLSINFRTDWRESTKFDGLKIGSLTEATNNAGNWDF